MQPIPHNGTPTSREAAESMVGQTARLREIVLTFIRDSTWRGMTCDEVEQATGLSHQTASARVNELMRMGAIVANGRRATRSGRSATVWAAVKGKP